MDFIDNLLGPIIFIIIIIFATWKAHQEEKAKRAAAQNQQRQPSQMQMEMTRFRQLQEGTGMPVNGPISASTAAPVNPVTVTSEIETEQNISTTSDESSSRQSQPAPSMNYAEALMTPDGIRNAIVLSEILRRPEERWDMTRN